jgi:hypothetical protein
MRKALILCVIALLMLAALNFWTWRQLTAEREQVSALREQLSSGGGPGFASARPAVLAMGGSSTDLPKESITAPNASSASWTPMIVTGVVPEALFKDPDYLRAWRTQTRAGVETMYPGVQQALKLSPAMTNHLYELLVDHLLATNTNPLRIVDGQIADPNQRAEWEQKQQKEQDEIATLLGPRRMAAFDDYKENLEYRAEVNILRAGMGSGPDGLRDEQVEMLIPAYRAAVESAAGTAPQSPAADSGPIDAAKWGAENAESRERDKALHARIVDSARSILDARQLALLELNFRKQEELEEAGAIIVQKGMEQAVD